MLDQTKVKTEYIRCTVLPTDKEKIYAYAKAHQLTVSELIRRALKEYIENNENTES